MREPNSCIARRWARVVLRLGENHPQIAMNTHNLAVSLDRQGRLAEAEPLFEQSIVLYRKVFGSEHPGNHQRIEQLRQISAREGL